MNSNPRIARLVAALAGALAVFSGTAVAHDPKAPLDSDQLQFLSQYVLVRDALAADDLEAAKKAAAPVAANPVIHHEKTGDAPPGFVQDARKLVVAPSLESAREIFKSWSQRAVNVTKEKTGYYIAQCPSAAAEGKWITTSKAIGDNPYRGAKGPRCGALVDR